MGPIVNWGNDWVWGMPLIVLTRDYPLIWPWGDKRKGADRAGDSGTSSQVFVSRDHGDGMDGGGATVLHGFEGAIWAVAYRFLGAVPDNKSAMLYSLGAMTTYGHASISLAPGWQLMGTLEALNGWILFGLTTAFLFAVMQKAWPAAK